MNYSAVFPRTVLVLDKLPTGLFEQVANWEPAGLQHAFAPTAADAIQRLRSDASVEIFVADINAVLAEQMLLHDELQERSAAGRATSTILLADVVTPDVAMMSLRLGATDLLSKPVLISDYTAALGRAAKRAKANQQLLDKANLAGLRDQLTQVVGDFEYRINSAFGTNIFDDEELERTLRWVLSSRALRQRHFAGELFADPAWDILLDLTRALLAGEEVSVSSVCIAAAVPTSTALRRVSRLTKAGLVRRWKDPRDHRRDLVALTDIAVSEMRAYLCAVSNIVKRR